MRAPTAQGEPTGRLCASEGHAAPTEGTRRGTVARQTLSPPRPRSLRLSCNCTTSFFPGEQNRTRGGLRPACWRPASGLAPLPAKGLNGVHSLPPTAGTAVSQRHGCSAGPRPTGWWLGSKSPVVARKAGHTPRPGRAPARAQSSPKTRGPSSRGRRDAGPGSADGVGTAQERSRQSDSCPTPQVDSCYRMPRSKRVKCQTLPSPCPVSPPLPEPMLRSRSLPGPPPPEQRAEGHGPGGAGNLTLQEGALITGQRGKVLGGTSAGATPRPPQGAAGATTHLLEENDPVLVQLVLGEHVAVGCDPKGDVVCSLCGQQELLGRGRLHVLEQERQRGLLQTPRAPARPGRRGRKEASTLKKPMTATSLDSTKASAAAPSARVVAAGPVRFFSQFTMSSASLPAAPNTRGVHLKPGVHPPSLPKPQQTAPCPRKGILSTYVPQPQGVRVPFLP